jgi:hypothetical protein
MGRPERLQTRPNVLVCNLMPRTPVAGRIVAILDAAPTHEPSGFPQDFTHQELAREVYGVNEPTAAQLSAVRRAVAKLVAAGRAERDLERKRWGASFGEHQRRGRYGSVWWYANPPGVGVHRPMTEADHAARAAVLEKARARGLI